MPQSYYGKNSATETLLTQTGPITNQKGVTPCVIESFRATVLLVALAVAAFSGRCFAEIAAQSTDSSAQTSQSSTQDNSQQTLDGCLVREEHAVYLMPASGDKTQVSAGGQDLNSHMGEEVRLKGNQGGSQSSQSSASSSSAGSSAGDDNKFVVTKVDVVAHTCPAEIQNRIDQDKKKSK